MDRSARSTAGIGTRMLPRTPTLLNSFYPAFAIFATHSWPLSGPGSQEK